ncbi:helix-turn-helix domain-containing protein [Selenomonas ruminantium]|uniref:Helix-turn-helix n=1 Tax=Selenomonas ruminantium TaxID=971 RepID=A0A1H0P3I6_SELRU|nr:helix-turn-helix transcriptional regulator [Selenomonas ruminantium]SDO99582.1 Helix-turn-helix [Selenomonas ruminantium]
MEKISINARVKAIRKAKGLSQAEFGKAISLKQGGVSYIEQEGNTVTEQNVSLICQKFRVRREWLVDGEGEMFISGEPGIFAEFAREYKLTAQEQEVAKYLLSLSEAERGNIMGYLRNIAAAMERGRQAEAKAAKYHHLVDEGLAAEEEDAEASSFSDSENEA